MNKKGIKLPKEIKEFYVNSVDKNGNYNSNKIGDILYENKKIHRIYI